MLFREAPFPSSINRLTLFYLITSLLSTLFFTIFRGYLAYLRMILRSSGFHIPYLMCYYGFQPMRFLHTGHRPAQTGTENSDSPQDSRGVCKVGSISFLVGESSDYTDSALTPTLLPISGEGGCLLWCWICATDFPQAWIRRPGIVTTSSATTIGTIGRSNF